jgi:hypothetical protein
VTNKTPFHNFFNTTKTISFFFTASIFFFFTPLLTPIHAAVVINEVFPKADESWVELYNTGSESVSLNLWKIENTNGTTKSFIINASSIISGHSFISFPKSQTGITFNPDGDTINLFDASGAKTDSQNYPGVLGFNTSMGRSSDGAGSWSICTLATQNQTNQCPPPTPTPTPIATPIPTPSPSIPLTPTTTDFPTPIPKSDTISAIISPIILAPVDNPFFSPTPTPTPAVDTIKFEISKTLAVQIGIILGAWIVLICVAVIQKRNKRKILKKTIQP